MLLVHLAGAEQAAAADNWLAGFRDVPASIAQEVNYAARQGWITGVTATAFRPDAALTANAWSAFLLRMLGYSDKAGDFTIADAAGFAQRIGLFPIAYTGTPDPGDLFEMAANALSFSYRDGSATVIGRLVSQGTVSRAAANALGLLTPALTARQVADRCAAAVFRLDTYETEAYRDEGLVTGEASGFFITEDGLAVTNYHSIADAVSATATLSTGDVYEVERVIYYDPDIDIAVIRVSPRRPEGTRHLCFCRAGHRGFRHRRPAGGRHGLRHRQSPGPGAGSQLRHRQRHAAGCGAVRPALRHEHRRHLRGQQRRRPC